MAHVTCGWANEPYRRCSSLSVVYMVQADSHTLQTAISTLVEAARLVAPLRKQEREFQVKSHFLWTLMRQQWPCHVAQNANQTRAC